MDLQTCFYPSTRLVVRNSYFVLVRRYCCCCSCYSKYCLPTTTLHLLLQAKRTQYKQHARNIGWMGSPRRHGDRRRGEQQQSTSNGFLQDCEQRRAESTTTTTYTVGVRSHSPRDVAARMLVQSRQWTAQSRGEMSQTLQRDVLQRHDWFETGGGTLQRTRFERVVGCDGRQSQHRLSD